MNPSKEQFGIPLWHQSGVSPNGEPFVQLLLGDKIIAQLSPEQARDHGRQITEAAEAAEQDAFIMDFFQHHVGVDFQEAGRVLMALRHYRQERTGKSQGPRNAKDWVMPAPGEMPNYGEFWKKDKPSD